MCIDSKLLNRFKCSVQQINETGVRQLDQLYDVHYTMYIRIQRVHVVLYSVLMLIVDYFFQKKRALVFQRFRSKRHANNAKKICESDRMVLC